MTPAQGPHWVTSSSSALTRSLVALALLIVGSLLIARLRPRAVHARSRTKLQFVATNPWMLEQFCTSLGTVLREWPELREVSIDVQALLAFDDASAASIKGALATARGRRVELKVSGHTSSMARAAIARGVEARCFGAPRAAAVLGSSLH